MPASIACDHRKIGLVKVKAGSAPVPEERVLVQLTNKSALQLANLQTLGLRKVGIKRADLIDSDKPRPSSIGVGLARAGCAARRQ